MANLRDVTARVEAEEAVRFQARLLAAAGQAIIATDNEGKVIYWNAAAESTYGWTADEATGRSIVAIFPPSKRSRAIGQERQPRPKTIETWTGEFWLETKAGTPIPITVTNTPVFDDDGVQVGTIGVSSDITERRNAEVALAHQAEHDELTQLPNRKSLTATLGAFPVELGSALTCRGRVRRTRSLQADQ